MVSYFLLSCDPELEAYALHEVHSVFQNRAALLSTVTEVSSFVSSDVSSDVSSVVWLDDGIALIGCAYDFDTVSDLIRTSGAMFIRHIAPVDHRIELHGTPDDIAALASVVERIVPRIDRQASFAVQSRIIGEGKLPYRKFEINSAISTVIEQQTDSPLDCRKPAQIVSILCTATVGYIGLSRPEHNLSDWPGGEHRFRREEAQISRAEFKLLEALQVFGIEIPSQKRALDLGAAPGGWTRVLRLQGMKVTAVDPAELDVRLRNDNQVTHVRRRVQEFLPKAKSDYAFLVNDMRMDALESAQIMGEASKCLLPGSQAIMTLKLPHAGPKIDLLDTIQNAITVLSQSYVLIGVRQLYHNRSEVTVAMRT